MMDFEKYVELGKVKVKTPDAEEAKALLKKSNERLEFISQSKITHKNSSFILENSYEAIREAIQSLMSVKSFKQYSHEATIAFLKKYYSFAESTIYELDRYRQLRCD